jgi:hypothetical protein
MTKIRKLNNAHRAILANLAAERFDDAALAAKEQPAIDAAVQAIVADLTAIPASEIKALKRFGLAKEATYLFMPSEFRIYDRTEDRVIVARLPATLTKPEVTPIEDRGGARNWDGNQQTITRMNCQHLRERGLFRSSVAPYQRGALAIPATATPACLCRTLYHLSSGADNPEAVWLHTEGVKRQRPDKTTYTVDRLADEASIFKAKTQQLVEQMYRVGHDRWHKKMLMVQGVLTMIRNATSYEELCEMWPEAKDVERQLFPESVAPVMLPSTLTEDVRNLIEANMKARGVAIPAKAA